jgi:anti-sigma factor RsiW
MTEQVPDDILMALADGELDAAEAAALRARIATDPELAERFASFVETRALLEPTDRAEREAVPPHLIAGVLRAVAEAGAAPVVAHTAPLAAAKSTAPARVSFAARFAVPLAASIALVLGGVAGYALRPVPEAGTRSAALPAPLLALVQTQPSGTRHSVALEPGASATVTIEATYAMEDGDVCREVSILGGGAQAVRETRLVCRRAGEWRTRLVVVDNAGDGFRPASAAHDTVEHHLEGMGAKGRVSGDAERTLLQQVPVSR